MSTDNAVHEQANRNHHATMQTRRVTIRSEVEADVEWRDDDPDYCRRVAALEVVDGPSARSNNWTRRVQSIVVEHQV